MAGDPASAGLTWLDPEQVGDVVARWEARHPDGLVAELRGGHATDRSALFDEAAATLSLPSWFGRNWDALYDALTDLSWLGRPAYLLVVSEADRLLEEHPDQRRQLLEVLTDAAAWWDHNPGEASFTTLLVTTPPPAA